MLIVSLVLKSEPSGSVLGGSLSELTSCKALYIGT